MRLNRARFVETANEQLADILDQGEEAFGSDARTRYEALIAQAIQDLLGNPERPGVRLVDGRIHYHLRHSRIQVPKELGRVGAPRHLIVARVEGEALLVLAVAYDGMVDELASRISESENE